jgi:hypothetical protein
MIAITDHSGQLEIISPMPWGQRLLFGLLALFPLLAPYELLWRIQWTEYWNLFFLLAAFISAGALALSAFLVFAAVAGLSSRISLDAAGSTLTFTEVAPVVPRRTRVFPLAAIASVDLRIYDWSDSAPSYALSFTMVDGPTFTSGSSWSRAEVEGYRAQVAAFLDRESPAWKASGQPV